MVATLSSRRKSYLTTMLWSLFSAEGVLLLMIVISTLLPDVSGCCHSLLSEVIYNGLDLATYHCNDRHLPKDSGALAKTFPSEYLVVLLAAYCILHTLSSPNIQLLRTSWPIRKRIKRKLVWPSTRAPWAMFQGGQPSLYSFLIPPGWGRKPYTPVSIWSVVQLRQTRNVLSTRRLSLSDPLRSNNVYNCCASSNSVRICSFNHFMHTNPNHHWASL